MTLDWADLAIAAAALCGVAVVVASVWVIRGRRAGRAISTLQTALSLAAADPQAAMAAFLKDGEAVLKAQAEDLHGRIVALEVEIARKRKRLSDIDKQLGRKDGEIAFRQEALALLNRRLIEYQTALARLQQQRARSALIVRRIESGELDPARSSAYLVEADAIVDQVKASGRLPLRGVLLDPDEKARADESARPGLLADWRVKAAQEQRAGPRVKPRLAK